MSAAADRRIAQATETARPDDGAKDRDRIAPLRIRDLNKVYRDSYGLILPADEDGEFACHVWLVHQARTGDGAEARMDNFLEFRAPWMSPERRQNAKEAAFRSTKFYGADELAIEFGVNYAKRTQLNLTTIGSIDVDATQRKAIRKEKQRKRQSELRLCERLRRKERPTVVGRRAADIDTVLPPTGWFDVVAICVELKRLKVGSFTTLVEADAFRVAVHRAIDFGVKNGLFLSRKEPGPGGLFMTRQVKRRGR